MNRNHRTFDVSVSDPNVRADIALVSSADGIDLCRLTVVFPEDTVPTPVTVSWEEDMVNILSVWNPTGGRHRAIHQWFGATQNHSRFCYGAPILCTVGEGGINTQTVAVSDVCGPVNLSFCVKDLDQRYTVGYSASFFTGSCTAVREYTADIRIDCRPIPYYDSILSVSGWWTEYGHTIPDCPPAAKDPLYSSWYNFHQAPDGGKLLADLEVAADLGFRTVILDDGWQFAGPSTGDYSLCGEWQVSPDKFPDFRAFADGVHALGMKLMVWFSVPFVGYDSPVYRRFEGKYLYSSGGLRAGILDPRYPEVRAYIKDTYKRFLRDYDIDGFKLDFIDSFHPGDLTAAPSDEMDCAVVDDAVRLLLLEIEEELAAVKPDLLYEYRQNYIGPAINRFGNMLRVGDCAYDALTNRIGIVDLRLLGYPVAVHSDMLFWSVKESDLLCAKQLLNILFGVPQISVILGDSTENQRKLLKHFLDYWTANRDILLHGTFRPLQPELNYTSVTAEGAEKSITVLYADLPYTWNGKDCDIFLGGEKDGLIVENPSDRILRAEWFDCFGEPLGTMTVAAGSIVRVPVPCTGMVRIRT